MKEEKINITPFGKQFRAFRAEHNISLEDAAKTLGVSGSYLTAVERGEKTLCYKWIDTIVKQYKLNKEEADKFWNSFDTTPKTDKISRSLIAQMMRNFYMNVTHQNFVPEEYEKKIQRFIHGKEMNMEDKKS